MKRFKEIFEEYREEIRKNGAGSLYDESFLYWVNNYVNQNGSVFNPYDFSSGKIYTFEYNTEIKKGKKYINKRPVVFLTEKYTSADKMLFSGVDLILIQPDIRLILLDQITSVYKDVIEENQKRYNEGEILDQIPLKTDFETFNSISNGIPFKGAYKAWDLKKVRDAYEIPFGDWAKIVYLHTRSIEGSPIDEIYKDNMSK